MAPLPDRHSTPRPSSLPMTSLRRHRVSPPGPLTCSACKSTSSVLRSRNTCNAVLARIIEIKANKHSFRCYNVCELRIIYLGTVVCPLSKCSHLQHSMAAGQPAVHIRSIPVHRGED
jgi:hypothetical protein